MDDNNYDYTIKFDIYPEYNDGNINLGSDDLYIINHIKKIVDNVRKVVKQMCPNVQEELIGIFIKLPFNTNNPIILGCRFYNMSSPKFYIKYYNYFDKKISPLNVVPRTVYGKLRYYYNLPIQLLDYISNFDSIFDVIYYKVSSDENIHIFKITLTEQKHKTHIDYKTSDILISNKLKKLSYSGLNDVQIVEEFMEIAGHIFRSTAKSARN